MSGPVTCGMVDMLQDPDGRDYNVHCDEPGIVVVDGVLMCQGCADRVTAAPCACVNDCEFDATPGSPLCAECQAEECPVATRGAA